MKITRKHLRNIIKEELQRLSFAKDHEFGIDTIPHAKKDKDFEDIIGHTWLTHVKRKDSSLNEIGHVLWHSINKSGEIAVYDVEWPSGEVETNIPAFLLEGVKDSSMVNEVHEAHGVQEVDQPENERRYKDRKYKK